MRNTTRILLVTAFLAVLTLAPAQAHAQTAAAPVVHGTFPKSGPVGSLVLIFGDNFSADPTKDAVSFNGVAAVVSFARTHALAVVVPAGATTGPVTVTVNAVASNTVPFTITVATPPTLTALVPAQGPPGTPVVIQGTGLGGNWNTFFGQHQGFGPGGFGFGSNSTVTFGTATSHHAFFTDTAVYTVVPASLAVGTVQVTVTINGVASNQLPFNVEATPPPVLAALTPATGPVGTIVTISGTGLQPLFGSFGPNAKPFGVSFNGTAAGFHDILQVTSQTVVCLVPVGATTGPVTVTVSGTASNALPYTVTPAGPPVLTTVTAKVVGQGFGPAGNVFVSFKLEGTGLGNDAQHPTLVVNGAAVQGGVRFVSDTLVEAFTTLPGPAPVSGTIALTVNAVTSNALPFTAQ